MSKALEQFIKEEYKSRQVPEFRVGDVVRVHQIVPDFRAGGIDKKLSKTARAAKKAAAGAASGPTERVQVFEGVVIAKKHGREPGASFTVRKIASGGIGVEKTYPLYSPLIIKIEISSRPTKRVRRSKLYFMRGRIGKKARRFGVGIGVDQKVMSVEQAPPNISTQQEEATTEEGKEGQK